MQSSDWGQQTDDDGDDDDGDGDDNDGLLCSTVLLCSTGMGTMTSPPCPTFDDDDDDNGDGNDGLLCSTVSGDYNLTTTPYF